MRPLRSLRGRIFLACALVAGLSLALALHLVTRRVGAEAEAGLRRDLERAAHLVQQEHARRLAALAVQARLVADLPTLKAAVSTGDPPTVQPIAADLRERARADVVGVCDAQGRMLAWSGPGGPDPASVAAARAGRESTAHVLATRAVVPVVTAPIQVGPDPPELLGTLSLGAAFDDALAAQLAAASDAEVVLGAEGRIRASSLPASADERLLPLLSGPPTGRLDLSGEEYVTLHQDLPGGVVALVLRSRSQRLAVLESFRAALLGAGLLGVALALVLGFAVAGTVSRPLAELSAAVREMTTTGDLARELPRPGPWSDEDAAVLSASLRALTGALGRLQREAALRERLSALGRLSAVIAHEVRNPLMIIKASLATLRRPAPGPADIAEVADDVAAEVDRLGRLVDGVLDYARPPRLEYAAVDLPALCREAALAASPDGPAIELDLDRAPQFVETDPERLRGVLVNLLQNARQAVLEKGPGAASIALRARDGGERVVILVEDDGVGIPEPQVGQVFEPYFTTRRSGTGLGLAIARNVVESLGGTISVESRPGVGSTFRVELPRRRPS